MEVSPFRGGVFLFDARHVFAARFRGKMIGHGGVIH